MYDSLSSDYDYFVNWPGRLALELPFLERVLSEVGHREGPTRVLDAACGTGWHAIALAQRGYTSAGADLSAGMIAKAQANAREAGVEVEFQRLGFGELSNAFKGYDALLCLGNSLPHLLSEAEVSEALRDFAACLRPQGVLLIQNRNFDAVLERRERWMPPEAHQKGDQEWLFLRFYDFDPDGRLTFHVVTLSRAGDTPWQQKTDSTRLYPQRRDELVSALHNAGFDQVTAFGSLSGDPFNPQTSGNLVLAARLRAEKTS